MIKMQDTSQKKKVGGRPTHEGWNLYNFQKIEGDKGKSVAKCQKCYNVLQNTTISRLLAHRKKCGSVGEITVSTTPVIIQKTEDLSHITVTHEPITEIPVGKVEIEEYNEIQNQEEVLWTQTQEGETYMDESVPHSSMDILNKDIKRHRKSTMSKRKSDTGAIDVALSSFLIGCNLTFDVVDSKHFKNFVNALNPDYKVPSSSQLTSKVLSQLKGMEGGERARGKKRHYYSSESDDYE